MSIIHSCILFVLTKISQVVRNIPLKLKKDFLKLSFCLKLFIITGGQTAKLCRHAVCFYLFIIFFFGLGFLWQPLEPYGLEILGTVWGLILFTNIYVSTSSTNGWKLEVRLYMSVLGHWIDARLDSLDHNF